MEEENGVWRTVNGAHIFIKNGQTLRSAMQESGINKAIDRERNKQFEKAKKGVNFVKTIASNIGWNYKPDEIDIDNDEYKNFINESIKKGDITEGDIENAKQYYKWVGEYYIVQNEIEERNQKLNLISSLKSRDDVPKTVVDEISLWKTINKSPYSNSFYNAINIGWNYKPEGSLRISDHWNFQSKGETHCKIKGTTEYIEGWKMCRYENGEYVILKEF